MSDEIILLQKIKDFLRIEGEDNVLPPLISAAKAYLTNAGVAEPDIDESGVAESEALALYELAVTIYVVTIYSGGESRLDSAMMAIILQIKDYGGEDS